MTNEHLPDPTEQVPAWRQELLRRRESKEVGPYDFDLNCLVYLNEEDEPLIRKDVADKTGPKAVVVTKQEMLELGGFDYIDNKGRRISVDPESMPEGEVLVLYPEQLGT
ncbi:hypothetical protein HYZ98_03780 [Candidatus Peregrinibacteria bacterium]|nr:hypothetical protein [Candidatus Peregrinibacteria bacterium]